METDISSNARNHRRSLQVDRSEWILEMQDQASVPCGMLRFSNTGRVKPEAMCKKPSNNNEKDNMSATRRAQGGETRKSTWRVNQIIYASWARLPRNDRYAQADRNGRIAISTHFACIK